MANVFKKIAKWGLIGVGSVLSLINPAIGAPLIVAGSAINLPSAGTDSVISAYGSNFATSMNTVGAMQAAGQQPGITLGATNVTDFIKNNLLLIIAVLFAIFYLPRLLRRR